jgi:hypothetical protein
VDCSLFAAIWFYHAAASFSSLPMLDMRRHDPRGAFPLTEIVASEVRVVSPSRLIRSSAAASDITTPN